jgi:hypothetical protein
MVRNLGEKLNEIQKAGVPYIIRSGNQLGEFSPKDIVGYFEAERLPEIVTDTAYDFFPNHHKDQEDEQAKIYARNLAKLSGKKPDYFLNCSGTDFPLGLIHVETHLIYNPKTDITHFFMLPSRSE